MSRISGRTSVRKALRENGKYKPLRGNRQTEPHALRIFKHGTERGLMQFLRKSGLNEDSPRFAELVKLFRDRGEKSR
jgi:hypothetical protein